MAIDKTGGIQLSSEIDTELGLGKSLGAYRDNFFLQTKSNQAVLFPPGKHISFSQLDGVTKLGDNQPLAPDISLRNQSTLNNNLSVSPSGTHNLSVSWQSLFNKDPQPVLKFSVGQNSPVPKTKWYETTGGGFVDVTTSLSGTDVHDSFTDGEGVSYNVSSQITVPLSSATTRTFVAVGKTFTLRNDEGTIVATNSEQFPQYTIKTTVGSAPTATLRSKLGLRRNPDKRTIITYTDGSATYYPGSTVSFYFKVEDNAGSQLIPDPSPFELPPRHNGYVATGQPYWDYTVYRSLNSAAETNVTSQFKFDTVNEPSFTAKSKREDWSKLSKRFEYTTNGNYKYRFVVYRKRAYTDPVGNAVTISVAVPEATQEVVINTKTIDNAKPSLLGLIIDKDQVDENPNRSVFMPTEDMKFTVTVQSQHAIGEHITISKSPATDSPQLLPAGLDKLLIESNEQSFTLGAGVNGSYVRTSRKSDDRTLTITASPYDSSGWESADSVSDSILVKNNAPFGPRLLTKEVDKNTVNEGESFTYTLEGMDFEVTDYTWETTFPADAVTYTSGTFSTPYTGSLHNGRYSGSFTVDTVERANHYKDVTGGQIKIFRNGTLYTQTGAVLKIKNTHEDPVTLPTKTSDPTHNVKFVTGRNGTPWSDIAYCIITLKEDGSYVVNSEVKDFTRYYANPRPLEGGWKPRITGHGNITQNVSAEDYMFGIKPSGTIVATASHSDTVATLKVKGIKLTSSIASASVTFNWEFYNESSGATRPGGTINESILISAIPLISAYEVVGGEGQIFGSDYIIEGPPALVFIDDVDVYEPTTNIHVVNNNPGNATPVTVQEEFKERGTLLKTECIGFNKFGVYADGKGGNYKGLIERNSADCGFKAPPKAQTTAPVEATTEQFIDLELIEKINEDIAKIGVIDLSDILFNINISF